MEKRNKLLLSMYIFAIFVVMVVFIAIWVTPNLSEFTKTLGSLIIGRFLGYIDQIYNFELGSTNSSKQKDETIANLSGGKL